MKASGFLRPQCLNLCARGNGSAGTAAGAVLPSCSAPASCPALGHRYISAGGLRQAAPQLRPVGEQVGPCEDAVQGPSLVLCALAQGGKESWAWAVPQMLLKVSHLWACPVSRDSRVISHAWVTFPAAA